MIIDSHAHYSSFRYQNRFPYLDGNSEGLFRNHGTRQELFAHMREEGIVFLIEPSVRFSDQETQLALVREYPSYIGCALGVHPKYCMDAAWDKSEKLWEYAMKNPIVAIGETGLDYSVPPEKSNRLYQKMWFLYQLRLAHACSLPLILHIREADRDGLQMLRNHKDLLHGGVVHCFGGCPKTANAYLELGFVLGIGGKLLQTNAEADILKETVREVPLESLIVETDAPYVLPDLKNVQGSKSQKSNLRNTSMILPKVIEEIARLREESPETVEQAVFANTLRVFRLHEKFFL